MSSSTVQADFYAELEVRIDATTAAINASYRRLSLIHHPDKARTNDKTAATEKMARLNNAREVLVDELKRKTYDQSRSANTPSLTKSSVPTSSSPRPTPDGHPSFYRTSEDSDNVRPKKGSQNKTPGHCRPSFYYESEDSEHGDQNKSKRRPTPKDCHSTFCHESDSSSSPDQQKSANGNQKRGVWTNNYD